MIELKTVCLYRVAIAIQGRRKQFYIGQANSGHYIFEHVGKGLPIDTQCVSIVQSTISMQSMLTVQSLWHAPQKTLENRCSEIESGGISGI